MPTFLDTKASVFVLSLVSDCWSLNRSIVYDPLTHLQTTLLFFPWLKDDMLGNSHFYLLCPPGSPMIIYCILPKQSLTGYLRSCIEDKCRKWGLCIRYYCKICDCDLVNCATLVEDLLFAPVISIWLFEFCDNGITLLYLQCSVLSVDKKKKLDENQR